MTRRPAASSLVLARREPLLAGGTQRGGKLATTIDGHRLVTRPPQNGRANRHISREPVAEKPGDTVTSAVSKQRQPSAPFQPETLRQKRRHYPATAGSDDAQIAPAAHDLPVAGASDHPK